MANPKDVLAQLLSPQQAEVLLATGVAGWEAAARVLGVVMEAAPSPGAVEARLVMPDEIAADFAAPHLVVPVELSTDQEQRAQAYAVLPTAAAAAFFDSRADDPHEQEQQTLVLGSTLIGQVVAAINAQVFHGAPSGLVLALDDLQPNAMPAFLAEMDEPALELTVALEGPTLLPLTLLLPGTFLDILAVASPLSARPASSGSSHPSAPSAERGPARLVDFEAAPLHEPARPFAAAGIATDVPVQQRSAAFSAPAAAREPTPISAAPAAQRARFAPLPDPEPLAVRGNIDLLAALQMNVSVELGRTELTVAEVLALGPGSVIELDRLAGEPVDILVNDRVVARGEVVVVDENFGVRVVEVVRHGQTEERSA